MKKLILSTSVLLLISIGSCKKKDTITPNSCANGVSEYTSLINTWVADPTNKSKCLAVVASLNNLLSCPGVTAADKANYQKALNDKPCDNL
jgi:hypothetical protein